MELGLAAPETAMQVTPLSGGVASDIAVVDLGDRKCCVKFALQKLKVAEDWRAPMHRNRAEYEWLRVAARIAPESSVRLFGCSRAQNGFAMDYLDGEDVSLWKATLLSGHARPREAGAVGVLLGRIHGASTQPGFGTGPFDNRDDFRALRIEPYLTFTATRWPDLSSELTTLANRLYESAQVLVHGDVSPKNILFRAGHPILLDAECATMGDACFDPAFCMNHLILKAIHLPAQARSLLDSAREFWTAYSAHVSWEPVAAMEARLCRLIPALMLARVDGKSPVEYLTDTQQGIIRSLAVPLILSPQESVPRLLETLTSRLEELTR